MEQKLLSPCVYSLEEFSTELLRIHVKDFVSSLQMRFEQQVQCLKEELLKDNAKVAEEDDYPAYGITGPGKHGGLHEVSPTSGERKLAHSAQMYNYQHQKQKMIAMEYNGRISRRHGSTSSDAEDSDEEENEEGDYTVYECPGLAPTGEMEVRNPLFQDDLVLTPAESPRPEMADGGEDQVQP